MNFLNRVRQSDLNRLDVSLLDIDVAFRDIGTQQCQTRVAVKNRNELLRKVKMWSNTAAFRATKNWLQGDFCDDWFHENCSGLKESVIDELSLMYPLFRHIVFWNHDFYLDHERSLLMHGSQSTLMFRSIEKATVQYSS